MNLQQYDRIPSDIVLAVPYFLTLLLAMSFRIVKKRANLRKNLMK
jgi:hypothetical protein